MKTKSNIKKSLISLPLDMAEELEMLTEVLHKKKSKIVTEALSMYFDYVDIQIASQRAQAPESGESKSLTSEQMRKELSL